MKAPIFLFSLPRAGSTLLQRVLMAHSEIASAAEPWILLPYVYALKNQGVLSEYGHRHASNAINDFIKVLPQGQKSYNKALSNFISDLYSLQCNNNEKYFLDKTPRYYYIIDEIVDLFPDAKFIFLFRNPLNVMSSVINTWSGGNLKRLYYYEDDLTVGLTKLSYAYEKYKDKSIAINYESFVVDPLQATKSICDYLEIEFQSSMLENFSKQRIQGRMGDPTGVIKYTSISDDSLDMWKDTFYNRYRKKMISGYIGRLEDKILISQGYNKNNLVKEINSHKVNMNNTFKDVVDHLYSKIVKATKANIFFRKAINVWSKDKYLS
ncbi:sulfotransferase [Sulfurimonas sp. HSL-3221]|uniref:sulfotransferase family protein n=1 Tax=Thiomicrolovo sulfuroxydans TaxID=2894755 RepID=UPI001E56C20A|nr:sulfotransferase [Sulfurimonas sp. HSL-3221]UFS62268.1 sulfotransferase [Sulfurimonas sp. HSL-3221]